MSIVAQKKPPLSETHPHLSAQWSSKNVLGADEVTAGSGKKVWWVCKEGHEWEAAVYNRSLGKSCPYCAGQKVLPGFNDLATTHPELADEWCATKNTCLPNTISAGSNKKVWWKCKNDHTWLATPNKRAYCGQGCRQCYLLTPRKRRDIVETISLVRPEILEEFIGDQSEGLLVKNIYPWKCKHCGYEWKAEFDNRMRGAGCPQCPHKVSKAEIDIFAYIESYSGCATVLGNKNICNGQEIDIYIPSHNFAIEFNGLYWHTEDAGRGKTYHANKTRLCAEKGIRLIHIWEDEWLRNPELVQKMIARKLGESAEIRVPARKTTVVSLTKDEARHFLSEHHIQGFTSGTYYLGLKHNKETVAVMVIKRTKQELRLERYATSCIVQGGFGKMIAWIQRNLDFEKITTFADLCVSDGSLYENNGWTRDGELAPDYRYVVGSKRIHKFNYRLKRFREDPDLLWEEGLTEKQLAELNGISRIWDCGKIRYVLYKEKNDKIT